MSTQCAFGHSTHVSTVSFARTFSSINLVVCALGALFVWFGFYLNPTTFAVGVGILFGGILLSVALLLLASISENLNLIRRNSERQSVHNNSAESK